MTPCTTRQRSLSEAEAAAERAEDATASAEEAVRIRRAALGGVAVDAFVNAGTTGSGSFDDSRGSGWQSKLMGELSGAAVDGAQERLEAAEADRERLAVAGEAAQDRIAGATAAVADAEVLLHEAEDELAQVTAAGDVAVALAQLGGDGDVTDGVTVLGDSVLSAQQMADFVVSRGTPDDSIDMVELAGIFLEEGEAEGVRGDIAFTQSILETGWFSFRNSMVDVTDNNYSGIGACDSCSNGYWYDSPRDGVRAQMQLLHTYADAELVSADLAHPPVRSAPERISVRGCCDTWTELTGVWATADGYGTRILELYADMLRFAGSV